MTVPGLAPTTQRCSPPSRPPAALGNSTATTTTDADAAGDLVINPTAIPSTATAVIASTTLISAAGSPRWRAPDGSTAHTASQATMTDTMAPAAATDAIAANLA